MSMSIIITILFICLPFITFPLLIIGIIRDKKHKLIYGILLALLLAIIAYNFEPKEQHDLYRYYIEMEGYLSNIDFGKFINQTMFANTKFLFVLLQYIVSQIGNYRLLPFIITFIGYSLIFYMVIDYSMMKKIKPIITAISLIMFIFIFYHIYFMSGLAQVLATIIAFFAFYIEYIRQKKKWCYKIFYILPALVHLSMIIIPLIRILLCFDFKKVKKFFIISLISYVLLPNIIYQILNIIPGMSMIAYKINRYMLNADSIFLTIYDIATLILLIFLMVTYYISRNRLKAEMPEKFLCLIEIILLFNLFSIPYRVIFSRIFYMSMFGMVIYLLTFFEKIKTKDALFVLIGLCLFSIAFGSVNINNIIANSYNNIFLNFGYSIIYYFK